MKHFGLWNVNFKILLWYILRSSFFLKVGTSYLRKKRVSSRFFTQYVWKFGFLQKKSQGHNNFGVEKLKSAVKQKRNLILRLWAAEILNIFFALLTQLEIHKSKYLKCGTCNERPRPVYERTSFWKQNGGRKQRRREGKKLPSSIKLRKGLRYLAESLQSENRMRKNEQ